MEKGDKGEGVRKQVKRDPDRKTKAEGLKCEKQYKEYAEGNIKRHTERVRLKLKRHTLSFQNGRCSDAGNEGGVHKVSLDDSLPQVFIF